MTGKRRVLVQAESRTVSATIDGAHAGFQYAGVTIQRLENSDVVEQTWLPLGAAPTYADDEALVDAWHAALEWSWGSLPCLNGDDPYSLTLVAPYK